MAKCRRRVRIAAVVVAGTVVLAAAPAAAFVTNFKISPARPYVDDAVTISWKTDRNLPRGQHYEILMTVEPLGNCAQIVTADPRARPRKGQIMRITLSPDEDTIYGGPQWCDGKADYSISVVKDRSDKSTAFVGSGEFRFRRQP